MIEEYTSMALIGKSKMIKHHNSYFSCEEAKELLSISDQALLLMTYYYSVHFSKKIPEDSPAMTDAGVMEYMGWSNSKTKKTRLALTRAGWFFKESFTKKIDPLTTKKLTIFYLGKDLVLQHRVFAMTEKELSKYSLEDFKYLSKKAKDKYLAYKKLYDNKQSTKGEGNGKN